LIVALDVKAVDGAMSTIPLVSETFEAAAEPSDTAPVALFKVVRIALVVVCARLATVPSSRIRPSGKV